MFHSEAWKCLKRAITLQQYKAGWYVVIVPCHEIWFKLRDWFLVKWHEVTSTYYVLCCDAWIVAKRVNKFRSIWHWQRFTEDDRAFPSLMVDPRSSRVAGYYQYTVDQRNNNLSHRAQNSIAGLKLYSNFLEMFELFF